MHVCVCVCVCPCHYHGQQSRQSPTFELTHIFLSSDLSALHGWVSVFGQAVARLHLCVQPLSLGLYLLPHSLHLCLLQMIVLLVLRRNKKTKVSFSAPPRFIMTSDPIPRTYLSMQVENKSKHRRYQDEAGQNPPDADMLGTEKCILVHIKCPYLGKTLPMHTHEMKQAYWYNYVLYSYSKGQVPWN